MADRYELNNEELKQVIGGLTLENDAGTAYIGHGEVLCSGAVVGRVDTAVFTSLEEAEDDIKEKLWSAVLLSRDNVTSQYRIEYRSTGGGNVFSAYVEYVSNGVT